MYFRRKLFVLQFISTGLLSSFVKYAVSQPTVENNFSSNDVLDSDLFLDKSSSLTSQLSSSDLGDGGGDTTGDFFVADTLPADDLLTDGISSSPFSSTDNLLTDNINNNNLLFAKAQSCASAKSSRKLKSRQTVSSSSSCSDPQAGTGADSGSIDFDFTAKDSPVVTEEEVQNYWCNDELGGGIIPVCGWDLYTPVQIFYSELECTRSSFFFF